MNGISVSSHVVDFVDFACQDCGSQNLRRLARQGFLQQKVFPHFGLYPWECPTCRKTRLYRKRGKRVRRTPSTD